jgi:hypothetical protein
MPVGNSGQLSTSYINTTLGDLAVRKRNLENDVIQFAQSLNQLGQSGIQNVGFTPADATTVLNAIGHLLTNAQVYFGLANQPANFNFDITPDLIEVRGGSIQ